MKPGLHAAATLAFTWLVHAGALAQSGPAAKEVPRALAAAADKLVDRGRYLVRIGSCNDCHTRGFAQSGGSIPETDWLTGDSVGFQGPWGTTYPANLRLLVQSMDEAQWVERAHTTRSLPPMPWFALRDMTDGDLRAIYRFIRHLGPAGGAAPRHVPPGADVRTPFIVFVPRGPN